MFKVELFELGHCQEKEYTRVICVSKYHDDYVFAYNKIRQGWEIPGGHIEENENWEAAARRELYEETGATAVNVKPVCVYKINSYGLLCYCEILKLDKIPDSSEMSEIMLSKDLPNNLTYPDSYRAFFEAVKEFIEKEKQK